MICIANETKHGLTPAIYTCDQIQANRAVRAIDTGMIWVKNYSRQMLGTPFEDVKHSVYGREHYCTETSLEWSRSKTMHSIVMLAAS